MSPAAVKEARILHAPVEIAGQVGLTVFGQREIGYHAYGCYADHPLQYVQGPDFRVGGSRVGRALDRVRFALQFLSSIDIFHFHYAKTLLPDRLGFADARLYRRRGKGVFMEVWGSDVRAPSIDAERNRFYVNSYGEDDRTSRQRLQRWAEITEGHVIASDHFFDVFLRPHFEHIHIVRQRVDTRHILPVYPDPSVRLPRVVHAPSQKAFKGTRYVNKAVESLRRRGLAFEYVEVHGVAHEEARSLYAQADLIIDQLCAGGHGVFAVEAMSLGKPVICYTLPDLVSTYPEGFPLINANPETVEAVLEEWIQRPEDRHRLGRQARAYAERVHDCRVVARRIVDVYERVWHPC
jgi:hypothetical protein